MTSSRRRSLKKDDGATLILVLIIVTVFSIVIGVILSQTDTSLRTTLVLRDQAASAYSTDGAAQIAINNLATGPYVNLNGQKCFTLPGGTTSNTLPLTNGQFASGAGAAASAVVTCDTDPASGDNGQENLHSPGQAILTLNPATTSNGNNPQGIQINVNGNVGSCGGCTYVQGKIFSYSDINVTNGTKLIDTNAAVQYVSAYAPHPTCGQGVVQASGGTTSCTQNLTKPADPSYSLPAASQLGKVPTGVIPTACGVAGSAVAYFRPGRYTDPSALQSCRSTTMVFQPNADGSNGIYFFDFPTNNPTWTVTQALIGGTLAPGVNPNVRPTGDGSCVDPIHPQGGTPQPGVEFVFGRTSQLTVYKASGAGSVPGIVEICGSRDTTPGTVSGQPPIALYTPEADVRDASNTIVAHAFSQGTAVLSTTGGGKPLVFLRGTAYVPYGVVNLSVANASTQLFNFGIIAWELLLDVNPQNSGSSLIYVDNVSDGSTPTPVVTLLRVYTCAGASACSTSGTPRLLVKVSIAHPSGGPATASILSWSQPN